MGIKTPNKVLKVLKTIKYLRSHIRKSEQKTSTSERALEN